MKAIYEYLWREAPLLGAKHEREHFIKYIVRRNSYGEEKP